MTYLQALFSVSDKTGLVDFARGLHATGVELIASGGTATALRGASLPVREISELTGFPEILGGRVKTLHPAVYGGILARAVAEHQAELTAHGITPIDLVVCNLYPFADTVARHGVTPAEAVEQIDIGGVTLLRAAAKNYERVAVVCDPADYAPLLAALQTGAVDEALRRRLALKAFRHTAAYDAAIAGYLAAQVEPEQPFPATLITAYTRAAMLRYGENPHQAAALYRPAGTAATFIQLSGKEMSYNNWLDLDAAWGLVQEFSTPTAAIIKHTNPCGVAGAADLKTAYERALASDPVSAFGSIVAVNGVVELALAEQMAELFIEVLAAPAYTEDALARLRRKANLRIVQPAPKLFAKPQGDTDAVMPRLAEVEAFPARNDLSLRAIQGGLLVQEADVQLEPTAGWQTVTARRPNAAELADLDLAWRVAKHSKSNAIVFVKDGATVGVGAGQMSRVDAVHLAARRAGERSRGAALASDAFFPFADGVEAAAAAGVTAVVQPGGSVRDAEVIAACDRLGLAMCFTGSRHFRH